LRGKPGARKKDLGRDGLCIGRLAVGGGRKSSVKSLKGEKTRNVLQMCPLESTLEYDGPTPGQKQQAKRDMSE